MEEASSCEKGRSASWCCLLPEGGVANRLCFFPDDKLVWACFLVKQAVFWSVDFKCGFAAKGDLWDC